MFKNDRVIALDIGASKIVLAEFAVDAAGSLELSRYGISRLGLEPESETDSAAYIVSTVRELMRDNGIKPATLFMTVSGQAVFPRYVKLPPVTPDKVLQIVQYEAEQNVPFPIDEVVWDYQLIEDDQSDDLNVMLVAVKIENITQLTDCVQAVGMEPEIVDVAPMAIYNCVRFNYPELDRCTMVLDIGARSSNLIFIEGEKIFTRSIPVAGNAITQELMKEFDIPFDEAEELKMEHAMVAFGGVYAGPESETADRVSKIVRNVITRLHAEVNRSINFYRSQQGGHPPSLVLLTGGSSIIPHTDTFFREKLNVQVEYLNPFVNMPVGASIDTDQISSEIHMMAEVIGLSLRCSLACPVEINLMPPNLVAKKEFRSRQPFFALTGAACLLIMVCWWLYFHKMHNVLQTRVDRIQNDISTLKSYDAKLTAASANKKKALGDLSQVTSLVEMRTRWMSKLGVVHSCLEEGMWLTAFKPIVTTERSADRKVTTRTIKQLEISGRGFNDKLKNKTDENTTPIVVLREKLKESEYFTENTEITYQQLKLKDEIWEFTITAELAKPINLR